MSWSELSPPAPSTPAKAKATVRIVQGWGVLRCLLTLRKALCADLGFGPDTRFKVMLGAGEAEGRLRVTAAAAGAYRSNSRAKGSLTIVLDVAEGWSRIAGKAMAVEVLVADPEEATVEILLPPGLFAKAEMPAAKPGPAADSNLRTPRAATQAREVLPQKGRAAPIHTPSGADDPVVGRPVSLPGRKWKPGAGAAKG